MTSSVLWRNVGQTNWWRLKQAVKIKPWQTRRRSPSGSKPKASEVDLALLSRWRVVHPNRHGAPPGAATLDGEAGQGAMRDDHATCRASKMPILVTVRSCFSHSLICSSSPSNVRQAVAMAVWTMRTDPLEHLADQLVAQLLLAARTLHPEIDGGADVAPDRLSIDADTLGDGALALTFEPAPQRLFDLDHRYLPKRHGASSPAA